MEKYVAYGFANTNRSDTEPDHTLAYKQLDVFNADRIVVDVHWHSDKREQLENLIAELDSEDVIYMYSVDTLLKGKNKGVEYYKQILDKNINLFVLDHSGDLPKVSPISTFYNSKDVGRILKETEKLELIAKMEKIAREYKPVAQTGKTTYKANITEEFKQLYFMYEAYRIKEKTLVKEMLPEKTGIYNKQTFISLCREYEKSVKYIADFELYCHYDKKFLELPKRTGKIPREYDEIIARSQEQTGDTENERIQKALNEMRIWSNANIIRRWKLAKEKVPKPRSHDRREIPIINFKQNG